MPSNHIAAHLPIVIIRITGIVGRGGIIVRIIGRGGVVVSHESQSEKVRARSVAGTKVIVLRGN